MLLGGISAESITHFTLQKDFIMSKAKVSTIAIIKEGAILGKLVGLLASRGKSQDKDYHTACLSALYHGFEHKSTGHAQTLLESAGGMVRKSALKNYLLELGCFEFKLDEAGNPTKVLGINKEAHAKGFIKLDVATAISPSKYSAEKEEPSMLVVMDEVRKLIARIQKASKLAPLDEDGASAFARLIAVAPAAV